ncbi:hypothetical protein C9439_06350 [archaeon SCG-AAA382B04]|nr:hypothetical protein C9439_06350 [archaeon SCG-AAA382B04]
MSETASIQIIHTILPAIAVLLPIPGAIISYTASKYINEEYGGYIASITTAIVFLITALQYQYISNGKIIEYSLTSSSTLFPVKFYLDSFGFIFAFVTSLAWMLVTIYSIKYMEEEHALGRFYFFLLLTLTANLGVVFGGDLFSIYIFFELLAVFSLILVVHEETKQAMKAGKTYFYIGVLGGLSLLLGIFLFYSQIGSLSYAPQLEALKEVGDLRFLIAGLMIIGFGVKAGIFPVHIWLPKAHPVAPTPASALLSGIMVKAGIFGIFRTTGRLFTPQEIAHATEYVWSLGDIGYWVIWIGIITAFIGWVLALLQDNMKRLLAYSTISQVGYITLGIGAAAYLGYEGGYGYSGALYHVFNHAMFKTTLFMVAGVVYLQTGEMKMSKLGGLWQEMPYTTIIAIIAAAGIAGIPFFNGYISKILIHHSILEAFHATHNTSLHLAEILFTITGGGTLAYYLKFIGFTFFGEKKYPDKVKKAPKLMIIPMAIFVSIIVFVGLFPKVLLNSLVLPSLHLEAINLHQIEHLAEINFFSLANLISISKSILIGLIVFIYAYHYNLLDKSWPKAFSTIMIYQKISNGFLWICRKPISILDRAINSLFVSTSRNFIKFCKGPVLKSEDEVQEGYVKASNAFLKLANKSTKADEKMNKGYEKGAEAFLKMANKSSEVDEKIDEKYKEGSKKILGASEKSGEETVLMGKKMSELSKELLVRNPVQFLILLATFLFNTVVKRVLTVFLYPYAFLKMVYQSLKYGPEKVNYTVKQEVKRIQKEKITVTPKIGSMGFAMFLVALMLAVYMVYELL